jgi:uncharacterized membrane protein
MNSPNPSLPPAARTPAWLHWVRALLLIALLGAGYLASVSLQHGAPAGCGPESGCHTVLQSRWAWWFGLPVSVPAAAVYFALLSSTILLQKRNAPEAQRRFWAAIIILSVVVAGAAIWFVSLQIFIIQSFCKYCLAAHTCGFAASLLCLKNIPCANEPDAPLGNAGSGKMGLPRRALLTLIGIGLAGVAALAGGQMLVQKQLNVVKVVTLSTAIARANGAPLASPVSAWFVPVPPTPRLIAPRTLSLYSNQFVIQLNEVPILGSPDAPHVIVCLGDYTCVHCRALHQILLKLSPQYSNQLAIICLPISLQPECNPCVGRTNPHSNTNACEYARLGLGVWRAAPQLFWQFDDWLSAGVTPPPVNQARDRAAQLVGADKLQSALADPWVLEQLLTDCKLHRANWLAVDSPALPQIVMGNAISSGPINSVKHLQLMLSRYLGLRPGGNSL